MSELKDKIQNLFRLKRAMTGNNPDDDIFSGLIEVKDIKERTRVDITELNSHTYMRLLKEYGGAEWEIMKDIADLEDHYLIALDGEQRKEAILMQRAKMPENPQMMQVTYPTIQTQPQPNGKEVKKK